MLTLDEVGRSRFSSGWIGQGDGSGTGSASAGRTTGGAFGAESTEGPAGGVGGGGPGHSARGGGENTKDGFLEEHSWTLAHASVPLARSRCCWETFDRVAAAFGWPRSLG